MIEGDESELPLFTELKKLDPLLIFRATRVAKMPVFQDVLGPSYFHFCDFPQFAFEIWLNYGKWPFS